MSDQILRPRVIESAPFPGGEIPMPGASSVKETSGGASIPNTTKPVRMPTRKIAVDAIGPALNTQSRKILAEFDFEEKGAMQIGSFKDGETGDIKISPDGIVARDKTGGTTFSIDGDDGSAVFKGSIQAGSLITGIVSVGDDSIVIDGEAKRQVFYDDGGIPVIVIGNA